MWWCNSFFITTSPEGRWNLLVVNTAEVTSQAQLGVSLCHWDLTPLPETIFAGQPRHPGLCKAGGENSLGRKELVLSACCVPGCFTGYLILLSQLPSVVGTLIPFYTWEKWGTERWTDLFKVTQLQRGLDGIWIPNRCSFHFITAVSTLRNPKTGNKKLSVDSGLKLWRQKSLQKMQAIQHVRPCAGTCPAPRQVHHCISPLQQQRAVAVWVQFAWGTNFCQMKGWKLGWSLWVYIQCKTKPSLFFKSLASRRQG